jgi:hypothetical protein
MFEPMEGSEPLQQPAVSLAETRAYVARGIVWTAGIGVLGFVTSGIWLFVVPKFAKMFDEMMGNEPLPLISELVIRLGMGGAPAMLLLAGLGIAPVWLWRDGRGLIVAAIVVLLQFAALGLVVAAMFMPLIMLIDALGG